MMVISKLGALEPDCVTLDRALFKQFIRFIKKYPLL
jgi:hypothetical protein